MAIRKKYKQNNNILLYGFKLQNYFFLPKLNNKYSVQILPGTDCARAEVDGNELLLERVAVFGVVDRVARN